MSNSNEDLWPPASDLTAEPTDRAPLQILREQAARLGEKTQNLVEAEVSAEPTPDGSTLRLRFILFAPALGYRYVLLEASQPVVDLYPVRLVIDGSQYQADEERGFKLYLENLFKSARTRRIISMLIAQSKSA